MSSTTKINESFGFCILLKLKKYADDIVKIYDDIGLRRGFLLKQREVDYEKVSVTFLHEFRNGKFGPVILDRVSELEEENV